MAILAPAPFSNVLALPHNQELLMNDDSFGKGLRRERKNHDREALYAEIEHLRRTIDTVKKLCEDKKGLLIYPSEILSILSWNEL